MSCIAIVASEKYKREYMKKNSLVTRKFIFFVIFESKIYIFNNFLRSLTLIPTISWRLGSSSEKNLRSECWASHRESHNSSSESIRYRYVTGIQWVLMSAKAELSKISSYTHTNWRREILISIPSSSLAFLLAASRDLSHLFIRPPGI